MKPTDKIAFVGPNTLAATTLFKILSGEMEPDSGSYKWGVTTTQSYFPKDNTKDFSQDETIVEWLTQYSEIKMQHLSVDSLDVCYSLEKMSLKKLVFYLEERSSLYAI